MTDFDKLRGTIPTSEQLTAVQEATQKALEANVALSNAYLSAGITDDNHVVYKVIAMASADLASAAMVFQAGISIYEKILDKAEVAELEKMAGLEN